jgi:hypothetical protein
MQLLRTGCARISSGISNYDTAVTPTILENIPDYLYPGQLPPQLQFEPPQNRISYASAVFIRL